MPEGVLQTENVLFGFKRKVVMAETGAAYQGTNSGSAGRRPAVGRGIGR